MAGCCLRNEKQYIYIFIFVSVYFISFFIFFSKRDFLLQKTLFTLADMPVLQLIVWGSYIHLILELVCLP